MGNIETAYESDNLTEMDKLSRKTRVKLYNAMTGLDGSEINRYSNE